MTDQTLGHYRIESKLGEGGMAVVYKGRDIQLDRAVAIKVLPPDKVADPARNAAMADARHFAVAGRVMGDGVTSRSEWRQVPPGIATDNAR